MLLEKCPSLYFVSRMSWPISNKLIFILKIGKNVNLFPIKALTISKKNMIEKPIIFVREWGSRSFPKLLISYLVKKKKIFLFKTSAITNINLSRNDNQNLAMYKFYLCPIYLFVTLI